MQKHIDKEPLKEILNSIKIFLQESTIYESLPQNSQVLVVDKVFSCFDTFHVLVSNDCDDVVTWNSEISNFDGLITYSDVIEILLCFFRNIVMCKRTNKQIFEEKRKTYSFRIGETSDIGGQMIEEEPMDVEEEVEIYYKGKFDSSQQRVFVIPDLLAKCKEHRFEIKETILADLKSVTLKSWSQKSKDDVFKSYDIISIDLEKKLYEACMKMKNEKLHRIVIMDKESHLVVGTLTQRDILLFIIRNFRSNADQPFNIPIGTLGWTGNVDRLMYLRKEEALYNSFAFMFEKNISSLPVVDQNERYIGMINKTDMLFIIKDGLYDQLLSTNEEFLNFLQQEKRLYKATSSEGSQFYNNTDSLRDIVQKLLFAPGNRLLNLEEGTGKIKGIITLTDLLDFYLENFS